MNLKDLSEAKAELKRVLSNLDWDKRRMEKAEREHDSIMYEFNKAAYEKGQSYVQRLKHIIEGATHKAAGKCFTKDSTARYKDHTYTGEE